MNVSERPEEDPMKFQFLVRFYKKHVMNLYLLKKYVL